MAENQNNRAGPHREVSSAFKGVPIPQSSDTQQPSGAPEAHRAGDTHPKPSSTRTQKPKAPNPYQFTQSSRKSTPAKQPRVDTFVETARQSIWQRIKDKLFAPKPGVCPTRQKAMIILVPVLAIVMVFMFRQVFSSAPDKTEAAPENNLPASVAVNDSGGEINWQIPEPYPATLRDPIRLPDRNISGSGTWSETTNITQIEELNVKGIIYSVDKPSAVVGNQIVHVSEKVDDTVVTKINRDYVEFERDGETWIQKVGEKGEGINEKLPEGQNVTEKEPDEENI